MKQEIRCWDCMCLMPYDDPTQYICPACGKVWKRKILKPVANEVTYIPGAKAELGGKSVKNKNGKEKMKKPTIKTLYNRLYEQV